MGAKDKVPEKESESQAWLVKTGMHTELQKFGQKPNPAMPLLDSLQPEVKEKVTKYQIDVVGLEYTDAQNRALFAIQKLLSQTNYRGNIQGSHLDGYNGLRFEGYLPGIQFTPPEYLDAYGVKKYKTARGKYEYSGKERREALDALVDLAIKQNLIIYRRVKWVKNRKGKVEEWMDRIETVQPLIRVTRGWEALTKKQDALLDQRKSTPAIDKKLSLIALEPCPVLVDQIDSYFVLKPANYREEIQLKLGPFKVSKYTFLFIDYLMTQAELKRRSKEPLIIRISLEELSYKLRLECYLKTRNYKRIRQILNNSCKIAKDFGYLLDYKTTPGVTKEEVEEFILNQEKFAKALAIEEARNATDQWRYIEQKE